MKDEALMKLEKEQKDLKEKIADDVKVRDEVKFYKYNANENGEIISNQPTEKITFRDIKDILEGNDELKRTHPNEYAYYQLVKRNYEKSKEYKELNDRINKEVVNYERKTNLIRSDLEQRLKSVNQRIGYRNGPAVSSRLTGTDIARRNAEVLARQRRLNRQNINQDINQDIML